MHKRESFLNLFKSMRIIRTFPILVLTIIPVAYTNTFVFELWILGLVILMIYSASGIYNAYKDHDYILPKYFKKIIFILVFVSLLIASLNKFIITASLFAILFGYIYNTFARKIILGDTLFAGITHFILPFVTSSLLVNLNLKLIIYSSVILYLIGFCIGPLTNLKDIQEDKKRNYKTLVNTINNPYIVASILFALSFVLIFIFYRLFGIVGIRLFFLLPVLLLNIFIVNRILKRKEKEALNFMRFYLITAYFLLIINLTSNLKISLISLGILIFYLFIIIFNKNGKI